jgi:hypothetical protein
MPVDFFKHAKPQLVEKAHAIGLVLAILAVLVIFYRPTTIRVTLSSVIEEGRAFWCFREGAAQVSLANPLPYTRENNVFILSLHCTVILHLHASNAIFSIW